MVSRLKLRRKIRCLKSQRVYKSPKTRKVRKQNVKSVRRQRSRSPYRRLKSTSRSPRFNNFRPQFLIPAPPLQVQPESLIQAPKAQLPQPSQLQIFLQIQPQVQPQALSVKSASAPEIVIQRAATQRNAQSALALQLENHKEADRQRLVSLQTIAQQQANDLKIKKGEVEAEELGRPLVPAINAPGPQCGSVICKKREKCIEGICTKTRLNVNFPNDLEEIRFIDKVNGGST